MYISACFCGCLRFLGFILCLSSKIIYATKYPNVLVTCINCGVYFNDLIKRHRHKKVLLKESCACKRRCRGTSLSAVSLFPISNGKLISIVSTWEHIGITLLLFQGENRYVNGILVKRTLTEFQLGFTLSMESSRINFRISDDLVLSGLSTTPLL